MTDDTEARRASRTMTDTPAIGESAMTDHEARMASATEIAANEGAKAMNAAARLTDAQNDADRGVLFAGVLIGALSDLAARGVPIWLDEHRLRIHAMVDVALDELGQAVNDG